jgi:hypothetical protein
MLAPWTFKCPQIGMGGARLDPRQHHAALTLRAARPFDWKYRRLETMGFRHVMHPDVKAGAQNTLSHRWQPGMVR